MPLLTDDEWAVVWQARWPMEVCRDTSEIHSMRHERGSDMAPGDVFRCENCNQWFAASESEAFFAAAYRMGQLIKDKHHQN